MRKLTPEEKKALEEKLRKEGYEDERSKPIALTITDDEKEEMKKKLAQAEHEKLGRIDSMFHSRKAKKK